MPLPLLCYFVEFCRCRSNRLASVWVPKILETLGSPLKMIGVSDPLETITKVLPPKIWSFWVKRLVRNYGDPQEKFDPLHL